MGMAAAYWKNTSTSLTVTNQEEIRSMNLTACGAAALISAPHTGTGAEV
jgi:hypothetical protein